MSRSCFADRLGEFLSLTMSEIEALERLEQHDRMVRRAAVLVRENDRPGEVYVLKRGMLMSYVILADGSRQILRFLFPGDMIATWALAYCSAPETIVALTDSVVSPFKRAEMARIVAEHPRLSGALIALDQIERIVLTDRLAAVGRTSAKARVASVLLEIRDRMRRNDRGADGPFTLGLTQEEIGDATGLTAVHVNRMLRQLEESGLIAREAGKVAFLDEAALRRKANYVNRFDNVDLGWLPSGR